ncbi:MAG: DNA replication/repair protein RecF [Parachlamydiales bacterium]|jgi:DNA replication and repair protein RecF
MEVSKLTLFNVRVYERKSFEFSEKVNLISGANAQGKTTILEALFVCAVGRSFRTAQNSELVRRESPGFAIEIQYQKCSVEQEIKVCGSPAERYVVLNGTRQNISALQGGLTAVASTPDDIHLVKGSPSFRRDYLDLQLMQTDPLYSHHFKRYNKALKQRNSLLRLRSNDTLDNWEYELAHSAAYIIEKRLALLEALSPLCSAIYGHLVNSANSLTFKYKPGISLPAAAKTDLREHLRALWHTQRHRDMFAETTLSGPHKDDFTINLAEMDLRNFGSQGEQRTAALTLKLAEWEQIKHSHDGEKPLLLLDDIGYGLDAQRQQRLVVWLQGAGQVFLTTTHPDALLQSEGVRHFQTSLG